MEKRKASSGKTKTATRPGKTKPATPVAAERLKAAEMEKGVEAKAPARTFQFGKTSGFPIVGVGASAGGLEALEALFRACQPIPGWRSWLFRICIPATPACCPSCWARPPSWRSWRRGMASTCCRTMYMSARRAATWRSLTARCTAWKPTPSKCRTCRSTISYVRWPPIRKRRPSASFCPAPELTAHSA